MIDDKTKLVTITSEYEKAQKNIPPMWVGEGWYKSVPNSFNYFASGFEAGLNYQHLTIEEIEAIQAAITRFDLEVAAAMGRKDLVKSWGDYAKALRSLLKRTKDN
jgi:hypothetical protein